MIRTVWKSMLIAGSLLGTIAMGCYLFLLAVLCQRSYLHESKSPTNVGSAVFYQKGGFEMDGDTAVEFFVRDYKISGSSPIRIDYVEWTGGGRYLANAVWSRDGSVIAVRMQSGWHNSSFKDWTHAYDFQRHRQVWNAGQIPLLLRSRGGVGQIALSRDEFFRSDHHPRLWEYDQF